MKTPGHAMPTSDHYRLSTQPLGYESSHGNIAYGGRNIGSSPHAQTTRRTKAMNVQTAIPATIDLSAIKDRQKTAWGSGDYSIVGTTLQIVGETLCEAVDLRSNQRVLDVAAGSGNATLAAARR